MRSHVIVATLLLAACTQDVGTGQQGPGSDDVSSETADVSTDPDARSDTGVDSDDAADASLDAPDTARDLPDLDTGDTDPVDVADVAPDEDVGADLAHPDTGAAVAERGCFFTVAGGQDTRRYEFGVRDQTYERIEIQFTLQMGSWREALFDREVLTHIFFGLFRNAPQSRGRYILGSAAQIRPARIPGTRQAVFFARVDLEPRPQGEGYTAYTSFRRNYAWEPGTTYDVHAELDVVGATQTLTVTPEGGEPLVIHGEIPYMERSLTSSGWWLQLGAEDTDHRDINVVGWTFCDLEIHIQ